MGRLRTGVDHGARRADSRPRGGDIADRSSGDREPWIERRIDDIRSGCPERRHTTETILENIELKPMNDTETTPELTVMTDGITVEKRYETDSFTVPAVAFRFRSDRDGETLIRLTDTIPPDVPPEDIGFHPDYGNDYWTVENDTVVFERRIEPNEAYETVSAIRTSDHVPGGFMTDPSLDVQGVDDAETQEPDAATPDTSHTTDDDAITDD